MAKDKLNIKKVIVFNKPFWKKLAVLIKKWIWKDMKSGKAQEYTGTGYQYTKQYARYKANNMRRFTDGKRLKGYEGRTVVSASQTPNMYLTGETIKGLDYYSSDKDSMKMSYKEKDKDKIIGNVEQGRIITTLNDPNFKKTVREFEKQLDKQSAKWAKTRVTYHVGNL